MALSAAVSIMKNGKDLGNMRRENIAVQLWVVRTGSVLGKNVEDKEMVEAGNGTDQA